jgi:hypothetical protein
MKKITLLFIVFLSSFVSFGQAKKPTIMVVPADRWCKAPTNNFMMNFDDQGTPVSVPDYKAAVQNSSDLMIVIGKINELMTDRDFPLKDLEATLKKLAQKQAKGQVKKKKVSPSKELAEVAKADIWMDIWWEVKSQGPKKYVTFQIRGLDAYTDKQIAGAQGSGQPSFQQDPAILLEEAVLSHLDNFNAQLQKHFDDLNANGREVSLIVDLDANFSEDLNTSSYGGTQLSKLIKKWVTENTVQGRFSQLDADETYIELEQVRIPLYDKNNVALDTQTWAEGLQEYLQSIGLDATVSMEGLGQATVTIKDKQQ